MKNKSLRIKAFLFCLCAVISQAIPAIATQVSTWAPLFKGIDYATATNTASESPGPLQVYVLRVSLNTPGVSFTTTPSSAATYSGFETFSQTTGDFVNSVGAKVGINANFFSVVSTTAQPENLLGLAVSNGQVVSQPEPGFPALVLTQSNAASIVTTASDYNTAGVWNAVAGSSIILQNGVAINPPSGTSGDPYNPNPRSAIGISQDGTYLYLMVIDGRSTSSVGCTQQQAGAMLALFGAYNGINLDGGGSSALVKYSSPGVVTPLNTPSGGSQRLDGNNLAVFADALPASTTPVLPYSQTVATNSPVAFYHFNETTGTTLNDASGSSRNGTYPAAGVTMGVADTAIKSENSTSATFNGASGTHATVAYSTALNPGSFTVEAWVKPTNSADVFQGIVSNRDNKGSGPAGNAGYILYLGPATGDGGQSRWQFWTGGTTADTYTALGRNTQTGYGLGPQATMNVWTHVVGTFAADSGPDGTGRYTGTQSLYVNGALALSKTGVSYLPNPDKPLYIGAGANEGLTTDSLQFTGGIDEIAIYNTALSAAQVQAVYTAGIATLSAPSISLSSPASGSSFPIGTSINLIANASDTDGSVTKVEFFDGAAKLGEVTAAPFSFTWTGAAAGTHTITLKATDDSTLTTTSASSTITITSTAPSVSLTSPISGASFVTPTTISLTATAADSDGTVTKVEFYADQTKLGEATTAPYAFTWTAVPAGAYSLKAIATDNAGNSTTSASVAITVGTPSSSFSYTQNFDSMGTTGTTPPTGWSVKQGAAGTTNSTWTTSIAASDVAAMVASATPLTVAAAPSTTAGNNNGYNCQGTSTTDRVLATSPTSVAGSALQLSLANTTAFPFSSITVGFDTRRYTSVATANELPGYWFFYSLDNGTTWTNALTNPTITTVPNTVGVTTTPATAVTLTAPWTPGATLLMRWVDDNAVATSPDQTLGLDNVSITAAADGVWANSAGGSWATPSNWSGNVVPSGTGKSADFNSLDLASDATVTLDGATTIGSLSFGDTTPSNNWTLATGTAGPLTLDVPSGTPSIAVNNQTTTISAVVAGTKGLKKAGAGTLVLSNAANTYSGTTTVSAGTLTISAGSYAPSTLSLLNVGDAAGRGVFNMNSTGTVNFTSTATPSIGGLGASTDTGAGAVNQTAGTLNILSGTLYLTIGNNTSGTTGAAYGSYNLSGGTLTIASGAGIRSGYGGMASFVQSGGTLNCGRYFVTGGGSTSGRGVTTFTGGTATVNSSYRIHLSDNAASNGILNIGTEAGGNASVTTLSTAGLYIMAFAGGNTALNLNSGSLTLGGPITKNATGTAALNLNGGTVKAGGTNITLIDSTNSLAGNVFKNGFTVDTQTNTATITANLVATAGLGIYPSGGLITNSGSQGSGYIGAPLVTISGGSGSGATAIANVSGGQVTGVTLTSPGQNYVAGDVLTFTLAGGGATTPITSFTYTLKASDLTANTAGGLTKLGTGSLTLSGTNTYTGVTNVNAGTLLVNGSNTSAVTVASGGTLGGTGTISGAVTVQSGGTLSPGAGGIGTLTVNNSVTLSGTTQMEISNSSGTLTSDRVSGITTVTYGGTLVVTNIGASALTSGNTFTLFGATTRTGSFTNITLPTLAGGLSWDTSRLSVDGTISVSGQSVPVVSITAPAANASFASPVNIAITVNATASAGGTVTKVEFFSGATKIGESTSAPFSFTWTGVTSGRYSLTAKVTDSTGLTGTSSAIAFTVNNPPAVSLAEPAAEQVFGTPANIHLSVNATDADGSITKVEYYSNGTKIGESVTGPSYGMLWSSVLAGSYNITAKATDDFAATTVSSPVHMTVQDSDVIPANTALADIVDTMIGVAGGANTGSTVPGPCLPQSSIYPSPDTVTAAAGGYSAGSDTVGFSQLHATGSGSSTMSFGNFLVSPRLGANTAMTEAGNASPISNVVARPYSYRGRLTTPGIDCTVVPTANCAIYQFDFPASTDARLYFDVARKLNSTTGMTSGSVTVDLANGTVSGGGGFDGNWNPAAYNVYFYAKLDTTPAMGGTWVGTTPSDGVLSVTTSSRQRIGSYVKFDTSSNRTVRMKIGISFQSVAKAQSYVESEIPAWDMAGLEAAAKDNWNKTLGVVTTPGGISVLEARKLYTALFHSLIQPRNRTGDPAGWTANEPFWDDQYTPWDTWQTLYPLLDIVNPASVASIVNSFGARYTHNGKAETAFIQGKDFQVGQGGDEVDRIIADAYVKGIPGIDWTKIWPLLQFNAGRRTPDYINLGFVSTDGSHNGYDSRMASGSSTIAFAHGDYCASIVGAGLGYATEAQALLARSANWRNVWDSTLSGDGFSGFVHGKARNGTFTTIAATGSADFYQGTCWNYSWNIFDRNAMMDLMGGRARFIQRLEFAFGKNSTSYLDFSNEVNLQAVPLLSRAQRPGTAAYWADNVRSRYTAYNCPGDEDSGAMSSLYFFLTAGLVPSATEDTYYLHGPRVPSLAFNVGGGKTFTVTAANAGGSNLYVQSATLDGQPLNTAVIHHSDIMAGKTLAFVMGPNPTTWGTGEDFTVPSRKDTQIAVNGGWTAALGSPQITDAATDSPTWGTGANGADNTAIFSAFPDVTLNQAGSSVTLSATVAISGMATTQAMPNARFAWGLFNASGQGGVTGWPGYLAGNDTVDASGRQSIWRKDAGNSTAFHSSTSATTLTSYSLPTQVFADGTYTLVMTLTRTATGALDYNAALVRASDGVLFAAFTGSDLTPPTYTFNRAGMRAGDVLDADSIQVSQASLIVNGLSTAPSVSLTAPAEGATFTKSTAITLSASATATSGRTLAKVEFFASGTKVGEAATAPYSFTWTGAAPGSYAITAKATDSSNETSTSTSVNITVTNSPPTVSLTSPAASATFTAPATVNLAATAADSDGTVSKVEFYNGATLLGSSTTSPYAYTWTNVAAGTYSLTAKATDNDGGVTTSGAVSITVNTAGGGGGSSISLTQNFDSMGASGTALPSGWSYYSLSGSHDDFAFAPPATATFMPSGSGTALVSGPAGTSTLTANATLTAVTGPTTQKGTGGYNLGLSASSTDRCVGTSPSGIAASEIQWSLTNTSAAAINAFNIGYDIRRFTTTTNNNTTYDSGPYKGVEELPGYWLFYSLDNGATWTNVAALNPTLNGSSGVVVPNSVGVTTVPSTTVPLASAWAPGATLLLRWFDDNAESPSPDQILGLDNVIFSAGAATGQPPTVSLTSPAGGATFTAPATVSLAATAADSDGTVTKVEFYNGSTLLGSSTTPPYAYSWTNVAAGTYSLTARATDDSNNTTTSAAVSITVAGPGTPPTVSLTSPTAGATFTAPATVSLAATAADSDGTVTKVEFYNGSTLLGTSTTSPYTYSWTSVAAGTYSLTAKATDDSGNVTTSTAVSITVNTASGGTSGTLTRGPYLQKASPTAMTIRWRSSSSVVGRVSYGTSSGSLGTSVDEAAATTEHEVRLTGLSAATTYFYSIGSANDTLMGDTTTTFTTPPTAGTTGAYRFWALGDAGTASSSQTAVRDAFYTYTGARTPDLVLQLGDNAYNSGLDTEYQSAVFNIYPTMLRKTPFWSCLGNHETNQATSFVDTYPYFNIYSFPTAGECGGVASGTEHYYSWDYGNIHFISLDSMTASRSPTGAMATWLTNDLASTTATWVVCIFHHPPYTKGSHDSDTETELIEMRQNILPILENAGVDLVLSGHSHSYERSYLLDGHYGLSSTLTPSMKKNGGDGRVGGGGAYIKPLTGAKSHTGTVYCVTGSAGQISGGTLNHPAHFISLNNLGSTVLDINGMRLDLTFLKSDGTTPDTFTMLKQDPVQAPTATTLAATNVTATSATLNATVNPNGTTTTAKFQSGLTGSYGTDSAITLSPDNGSSAQSVSVTLNGLQPGTTYNFRVSAANSGGTTNGGNLTFTTPKLAQTITFAGPADKTFGDAPFGLTATGGGSTSPVTFSVISGPASITGSTVTLTGAGSVTIRASQAADATYAAAADVDRSFTVAKASQSITFGTLPGKVFGDASFDLTATGGAGTAPVVFSIFSGPATISGKTVTITGTGNVTVRASQAGDANYLAAPSVDQTFTVAKAGQGISFAALADKTFGDAPFDLSATGGASGQPVTFSVVGGPATISGSTVTLTGAGSVTVRASQAGNSNYSAAADVDRTFSVAKASQIISFAALADKTFGDAPFDLSAAGGASGQPVTFSLVSGPATISGSTVTLTGAGNVTIRASQAGNNNYLAATDVERSFSVAKAAQVITFAPLPDKKYGDAPFDLSATGGASGQPVTFSLVSGPASVTGSTVTLTGAGNVVVRASQAGNNNYLDATDVERGFNVAKAGQGITFAALPDKTFGDAPFDLSATGGASSAPVTFAVVSGPASVIGSTVTLTGAGNVTIRASQAGDATHEAATDVDRSFSVAKAAQVITFAPLPDKKYGDAPFDLSATGGASGSPVTFSLVSGPATLSGSTVTLTGAGNVVVRASQAGNNNYLDATDVERSFNVAKAGQGITFAALPDKTFGDAPFDLSATGGASSAPVTFAVVSGPASVIGSTVTLTGAGSVTIRASQAGDATHEAATDVDRSFSVAKAAQVITFDASVPAAADTSASITLAATSSKGLTPVTFSILSGPGTLSGGTLTFSGPGSVVVQAAQAGDDNYLPATAEKTLAVTSATLAITTPPQSQIGLLGQPVTFSVSASGPGALTYQWRKNNAVIANAKAAAYTIPAATAASIGSYTVEVKNGSSTVTSSAAELVLVDGAARTVALAPNGTASLTLTTAGTGLTFQWGKDGTPLADDSRTTGSATSRLGIKALKREDAGTYACTVTKAGIGSRQAGAITLTVSTLKPELAPIDTLPDGAVGKAYSYQVLMLDDQPGQTKGAVSKFTATGLPAGLSISSTGLISGTPTASATNGKVSITATNDAGASLPEACTLTVLPLPASAVGTFVGRFERSSGINDNVGGRLDLTITAAGAFTAKLTQLGISSTSTVSSKGTLVSTVTNGTVAPTGATTFARATGSPLALSFAFDDASNTLSGTLADPDSGATTALSGVRNTWSAKAPAAPYRGYYTLALDLPDAAVGDAAVPQGNGFASFTVADAGTLTWTGKGADGQALTAATIVGADGQIVLFVPLAAAAGSLTGTAAITADTASSYADNLLSGGLTWSKARPLTTTDRTYKAGYGPVNLTVAGGKYQPPAPGLVVMNLPNVDKNARIAFSLGGLLDGQGPPVVFDIRNLSSAATQTVKLPLAGSAANPAGVTFLLAATPQGQFSGAFSIKTPGTGKTMITRAASYFGMIIRQGSTATGGYGYFLLPQLPATGETAATAPILSGQVTLQQAP